MTRAIEEMRILAATISHESNSFSTIPTDLSQFRQNRYFDRPETLVELAGSNTVWGGFLKASRELDLRLIPLLYASATPAGKVTREAFRVLLSMLTEGLERLGPGDGVLLDLHGAMVSEDCDDAEGHILAAVRRVVGSELPVIAVLDLHANISEAMHRGATVLIGYDTYPHTDMAERGEEAVKLLARTIRGEVKPVSVLIKPPMMPTSQNMATDRDPMRTLLTMARDAEQEPKILNVTVSGGFPPADVVDAGFSVVVTSDGDRDPARGTAESISRKAWELRTGFLGGAVSLEQAVQEATEAREGPITVVDIADNPASGGPFSFKRVHETPPLLRSRTGKLSGRLFKRE
jgi:microcystin degradation protein MlrC